MGLKEQANLLEKLDELTKSADSPRARPGGAKKDQLLKELRSMNDDIWSCIDEDPAPPADEAPAPPADEAPAPTADEAPAPTADEAPAPTADKEDSDASSQLSNKQKLEETLKKQAKLLEKLSKLAGFLEERAGPGAVGAVKKGELLKELRSKNDDLQSYLKIDW